jgi:DNA processing protein
MRIQEFLSILARSQKKINFHDFERLDHVIDIYDVKKRPQDFFSHSIAAELKEKKNWFDEVLREYELLQKKNLFLLYPNHEFYPKDFLTLEKPPLYLAVKGSLSILQQPRVSVVGSRHPSARVLDWMDRHLSPLVNEECVLVSGAARGVDQRAHAICLRKKKPTIAFLPSGLMQAYPQEFQKWIDKIVEYGGAVLSEYPCNQYIHSHHFHERNRMIATLGYFLLVCEARRRSGSIMTARLAIENSKCVSVVPSFPEETSNQGCVDLLFQGAFPIRDFQDLRGLYELEKIKRLSVPDLSQRIVGPESKNEVGDPECDGSGN